MRKYESVTGHIRCSICRARLLGGRLDTGVRQAQAIPEDVTLPAVEPSGSTISPLEAGWPSGRLAVRTHSTQSSLQAVKPLGLTVIGPSDPIARSHTRSGPAPVVAIDAVVDVDAHAPQVF